MRQTRQGHAAPAQEGVAHHRRHAEQIQHQPAVAAVVAQQVEVAIGNEGLAALARLHDVAATRPTFAPGTSSCNARPRWPASCGRSARRGRCDTPSSCARRSSVPNCAIGMLSSPSMIDGMRGGPQQLVAQVLVDELVQVEQVLQQLPARAERRRDQLDQRLGIVGGDVLVGERRTQRARDAASARCARRA